MKFLNTPKSGQILLGSPRTDTELVKRLEWCGVPADWGWTFCRTAGCHRCRKYRVKDWTDEAIAHFGGSRPGDLRFVTVMLPPVGSVDDIKPVIDQGKVAWRNIIHRLRQHDARGQGIRIIGVAEVDWYAPEHAPRLSGYKTQQLTSLGFDKTADGIWMPHFHLIADLAGLPERLLSESLNRKWTGYRQIDIRPLDQSRTLESNVSRLLGYSTKNKHYYKIDPFRDPTFVRWPNRVVIDCYNMLFRVGGYSLLRFHLKPSRENQIDITRNNHVKQIKEPMPFIAW